MAAERRRQRRQRRQEGGGGMDVDGAEGGGHDHDHDHDGAMMDADDDADVWAPDAEALDLGAHPPTSQALRLHAVLARRAAPREPPPRAPCSLKPEELAASVAPLREAALRALSSALGGDALAAEYVLAACLGCVHKRVDGAPHGHVHVNLAVAADDAEGASNGGEGGAQGAGGPSPVVAALRAVLASLLPVVRALPLTLRAVNAGGWAPRKDHESGRLARGALQLPPGSLLLLDETAMAAGEIGEAGVRSLQALGRVLTDQQLPVDFQFYSADYPLDVAVVTVSRGRSLLRDAHHVVVPVVPNAAASAAEGGSSGSNAGGAGAGGIGSLSPQELEAVRDYLGHARALQCQLDEAVAERLAAAFPEAARAEPGFTMERFNTCVTLAKLLSLSIGQDRFEMASWARAMELEAARRARVEAMTRGQQQPQAQQAQQQAQPQQA